MYTTLHVLSERDYEAWLDQAIADKNKPIVIAEAMDPASGEIQKRDGPTLYKTYCIACHGPEGQGGLVKNARNFSELEGWKKSPKVTDIFRTLTEGIEGTQMRSFKHLPAWDRFALSHHVAAYYRGPDRPRSTPEEARQLVKDYDLEKPQAPQERISIEQAMEAVAREAGHESR
jgi:mono/diheme cytochrome c family protein